MSGPTPPAPHAVPDGDRVLRVNWVPGSDRLRGRCFCGAAAEGEDPVQMWQWLLAHPDHPNDGPDAPAPPALRTPPAHRVTNARAIRRPAPAPVPS